MTKKGLVKKIALTSIGGGIIGAGMTALFTYGPNYDVDRSTVKDGLTMLNDIIEYKGKDKIVYRNFLGENKLADVKINGHVYTSKDTLIYSEAEKRYNYLKEAISIINEDRETERKNAQIKKELEEKIERESKDMEILKK